MACQQNSHLHSSGRVGQLLAIDSSLFFCVTEIYEKFIKRNQTRKDDTILSFYSVSRGLERLVITTHYHINRLYVLPKIELTRCTEFLKISFGKDCKLISNYSLRWKKFYSQVINRYQSYSFWLPNTNNYKLLKSYS